MSENRYTLQVSKVAARMRNGKGQVPTSGRGRTIGVPSAGNAPVEKCKVPYIIKEEDDTEPTNSNVYGALRSAKEFARKHISETIIAIWNFLKGLTVGEYVEGKSGAVVTADGDAEVGSMRVRGDADVSGGVNAGAVTSRDGIRTSNYIQGHLGGAMDGAGNIDAESIESHSWLKVRELIYNRLKAMEGDTSFADVGTIEQLTSNEDGTRAALMRKRWDGDFTAFQPGDVVYGYVNNLDKPTAKEYGKAWALVRSVNRTANTLVVEAYPDSEVPGGHNMPLTSGMVITRHGNNIEANAANAANPEYSSFIIKRKDGYANTRQKSFLISTEQGNIVQLMGVYKPILEKNNYGTVLGQIPSEMLSDDIMSTLNPDQPYLYARGILVQDIIMVDYEGARHGIWAVTPSMPQITVAADGTITPDVLACTVSRSYIDGDFTYTTAAELTAAGVQLFMRVDGGEFHPYTPGLSYALAAENGASITDEATGAVIISEGDDVETSGIAHRVQWELRDISGGNVLARASVPVVRDGHNGKDGAKGDKGDTGAQGATGPMVYPAGEWNSDTKYSAENGARPVVLHKGQYYVLVDGGWSWDDDPAIDYANGGGTWELFTQMKYVFADIVMANFAKLGSAIFSGDYMFSQDGTIQTGTDANGNAVITEVSGLDEDGKAWYTRFVDGITAGTFIPHFCVNLKTGRLMADYGTFRGRVEANEGHIGKLDITEQGIGMDIDGIAGLFLTDNFMRYTGDNNGRFATINMRDNSSAPGVFCDQRSGRDTNTALQSIAVNAKHNIAFKGQGAVVTEGLMTQHVLQNVQLKTNADNIADPDYSASVWVVHGTTANVALGLPDKKMIQSSLGIGSSGTTSYFAVPLKIIGAADTQPFRLYGRNSVYSGMNNINFPQLLNNNAGVNTSYIEIGKGDVYEWMLVWDGVEYYAYQSNKSV